MVIIIFLGVGFGFDLEFLLMNFMNVEFVLFKVLQMKEVLYILKIFFFGIFNSKFVVL